MEVGKSFAGETIYGQLLSEHNSINIVSPRNDCRARGVLQDNSRYPLWMLTLTYPVNLFLEKIMQETRYTYDHHTSISISGRPICNLQFADNMDLACGSNGKLLDLTNRLIDRAMAVSTEKSKIMTNSTNNISADISSKTHKRLKECFLIKLNRTKCANFRGNPLFQAIYNTTENS